MSSTGRTVIAMIKIVIPAGAAKPAPPVGPALGSHGLNIMSFCKDFNAKTADITADVPIPVTITAFRDKSFEWEMKSPPVSYFIKKAAGIKEGSKTTGHEVKGTISLKHVYEIAKVKQADANLKDLPLEKICRSIVGTAKSMGLEIYDPRNV